MISLILSKPNNVKDQVELIINQYDTVTSKKWLYQLHKNLQSQVPIKKHTSFHGWINDPHRTLENLLAELGKVIDKINKFDFTRHAVLTNQPKIEKDFHIDLDLSPENLTMDIVNELHDKFVQLEGSKTLAGLENVSPYFDISPPQIRWEISKINNLAHELGHFVVEKERLKTCGWYCPEVHVHFYKNSTDEPFTDEDNDAFSLGYDFGRIHIGDTTVGKTYWDAFNDNDSHIHNHELEPPLYIVGDFVVYLGNSTSIEENKMIQTRYWKWLFDRGLRKHEPANIRVGKPAVAECDFIKSIGVRDPIEVVKILNGYSNIYAIIVNEQRTNFEWTMSNEEIDIQYHA